MATLTTRQIGEDYYGYNSNCYEEGRCSWWWSDVRTMNPATNHPYLLTKLTLPFTDRLRRPLHYSRSPLLPPLRLLRRRLLARPAPRTQKPTTAQIPRLDVATQYSRPALLLPTRRAHVQQRRQQQPAKPILRPAAAPRQLRHAEQHFRAASASLSGW